MLKLFLAGYCIIAFCISGISQECNAKFEVNAGPDIEVCENGTVNLNGIIGGDATQSVWRGGKGIFIPDRNTLNAEYTPSPDEIGSGVVLILVASNPKLKCTPARNEIKITVNSQPKAVAGGNLNACQGQPFLLNGKILGKTQKTEWISNGTGKFEDPSNLNTKYFPSEKDAREGGCSLSLVAIPFGVCFPDTDNLILTINKGPDFIVEPVSVIAEGKPVKISITCKESPGKTEWSSDGTGSFKIISNSSANYSPSSDDYSKGRVIIHALVTDISGTCNLKKSVSLLLKKVN